ncbi:MULTISPECIES: organomercurial lyase [Burkholderiales]|uniref:organomercurial lyase n=1 Tax=Burkholderiales TaxID=80840 RepID=UPI0004AEC368|nr:MULTISPECIES: organomercurial lyase [Burkholderiales]
MDISNESRLELKAAVTRAQQKLGDEFPLQARIEGAQPTLQAAYAGILGHWVREAAPPAAGIAPQAVLDALSAMDAIVSDEQGIGCYPFSARKTEIRVHFSGRNVHAMCAIDALAIPRMVRHASRITARCVVCRCHLACAVAANGSVEKENQNPEAARVVWEPGAGGGQACCIRLCAGIGFVCRHCTVSPDALTFSLPQAAAVGNAFFAFQRKLLEQYPA